MTQPTKRIVTLMQTRRGSSRLPDKVFRPLLGKPLFVRQAERILASKLHGELVVATTLDAEDELVAESCKQYGLSCFRGEPLDVLDRHYRAARLYNADIVVKIPSDCPLIDPSIIDRVIASWLENEGKYDYLSNLHPATYPDGNDVEIMSFYALEQAWIHAQRPFEREHTTPYLWERPHEFRIGNIAMEGGKELSMSHRFTIDYEEDYAFIDAVFSALYPLNPLFGLDDILRLLKDHPEIFALNHRWAGVNWYRKHLNELKTVGLAQTKLLTTDQPTAGNLIPASLETTALKVREHIIRLSAGGGCFIGASLSCVETMVYLYGKFLNRGTGPSDPDRDYLFLSKGHDVPALYGTLVEMGLLEKDRLKNHLSTRDSIYWHPNRDIPGVEFHSGSLGHLPAVATGVALDCKISGKKNRIVVITGDGELNEGSVWETLLVANAYGLDNLTLVVDRNQFQANIRTEDLIPLEPLEDKFRAFGCHTLRINGHDFDALDYAFTETPPDKGKVKVIIADTIRGKGLPSIEARADRWFCAFSEHEIGQLLEELHGSEHARIDSETMIVR